MKLKLISILAIFSFPLCSFNMLNSILDSGNLHVEVLGLKNMKGQLGILVFENSEGFPVEHDKALRQIMIPIDQDQIKYTFDNLPFGEYAVAVMHDENLNEELDTNFLGIPKEGTGVSNNIKSKMGPPKFKDASFNLDKLDITKSIKVNY